MSQARTSVAGLESLQEDLEGHCEAVEAEFNGDHESLEMPEPCDSH